MPSDAEATRRWLNDIYHHIAMADGFVKGMDYEGFCGDMRTLYAVTRCLEIISEASRRLPDDVKSRHPSIEWQQMASAGNVYRHEYEDVAARRVWDTLVYAIPRLRQVIAQEQTVLNGHR